jgi:hypothetical protein
MLWVGIQGGEPRILRHVISTVGAHLVREDVGMKVNYHE